MGHAHHAGAHGCGHEHGLPHVLRADGGDRRKRDRGRLRIALALTSTLFLCELVGGLLSHSLALVSDAGHMLSDLFAQGIALGALLLAARPADARRTFGWHRIEILAALG